MMSKSEEELKKLMDEVSSINAQLADLTPYELEKVGAGSFFFEN